MTFFLGNLQIYIHIGPFLLNQQKPWPEALDKAALIVIFFITANTEPILAKNLKELVVESLGICNFQERRALLIDFASGFSNIGGRTTSNGLACTAPALCR